jgi:hypothetical protein
MSNPTLYGPLVGVGVATVLVLVWLGVALAAKIIRRTK